MKVVLFLSVVHFMSSFFAETKPAPPENSTYTDSKLASRTTNIKNNSDLKVSESK